MRGTGQATVADQTSGEGDRAFGHLLAFWNWESFCTVASPD
jgi:hypothetical protein